MRTEEFIVPATHGNKFAGKPVKVYHFESIQEFAVEAPKLGSDWSQKTTHDAWADPDSTHTGAWVAATGAKGGDEALAARAEEFLDQIDTPEIDGVGFDVQQSVVGGAPCVAAALAGHPASMVGMVPENSDRTPVRLFLDTTSGADLSADAMTRRGAAMLALATLIVRQRPVEIYWSPVGGTSNGAVSTRVRIPTAPFDLAAAGLCLAAYATTRVAAYDSWKGDGFYGQWGFRAQGHPEITAATISDYNPATDIVIPGIQNRCPIAADPVRWIREQLDRLGMLDA